MHVRLLFSIGALCGLIGVIVHPPQRSAPQPKPQGPAPAPAPAPVGKPVSRPPAGEIPRDLRRAAAQVAAR